MKPTYHITATDEIHASLSKYDRRHDREITRLCIEHPEFDIKQIKGDMYTPSRLIVTHCSPSKQREKIARRKEMLAEFIEQNERNKNYYAKEIENLPYKRVYCGIKRGWVRAKEELELIYVNEYHIAKLNREIKLDDEISEYSVFEPSYRLQKSIRHAEVEILL